MKTRRPPSPSQRAELLLQVVPYDVLLCPPGWCERDRQLSEMAALGLFDPYEPTVISSVPELNW